MSERREGHSRLHVENGKIVNERGEVAGAPQPPRQVIGEATVEEGGNGMLFVRLGRAVIKTDLSYPDQFQPGQKVRIVVEAIEVVQRGRVR